MNVVKFRYSVSRRAFSRKPRTSKNGTPEEREAKAAELRAALRAGTVIEISGGGIVDHPEIQAAQWREFGRLLAQLDPELRPAALSYLRQLADDGA
jgi:hypothetical protein